MMAMYAKSIAALITGALGLLAVLNTPAGVAPTELVGAIGVLINAFLVYRIPNVPKT